MTSARGRANHGLFLARIILAAWRREVAAEVTPAATLSQAYLPAVRGHLLDAYGWFLVEILRPAQSPATPPHSCADLPAVADGKALPGEIREFAQLEAGGWIGELLAAGPDDTQAGTPDNLATGPAFLTPAEAGRWADALQALFERMGDSLDEY